MMAAADPDWAGRRTEKGCRCRRAQRRCLQPPQRLRGKCTTRTSLVAAVQLLSARGSQRTMCRCFAVLCSLDQKPAHALHLSSFTQTNCLRGDRRQTNHLSLLKSAHGRPLSPKLYPSDRRGCHRHRKARPSELRPRHERRHLQRHVVRAVRARRRKPLIQWSTRQHRTGGSTGLTVPLRHSSATKAQRLPMLSLIRLLLRGVQRRLRFVQLLLVLLPR